MLDQVLKFIAPHHCYGCQKVGAILCERCKKHILQTIKMTKIDIQKAYDTGYIIYLSQGKGFVKDLIYYYKLNSVRAISQVLAELIAASLPLQQKAVHVVPIPTTKRSFRQRGFGHAEEIGRCLAKISDWHYDNVLFNDSKIVQKGLSLNQRLANIKKHLGLRSKTIIDPQATYLVIDDITTTGATLKQARYLLNRAGAKKVICLAIMHK